MFLFVCNLICFQLCHFFPFRFRREPLSGSSINSNSKGNSDSSSDDEYDQAKFDGKISDLKVLYPSRSRSELEQGLEMYGGDLDALVATMMRGSFDRGNYHFCSCGYCRMKYSTVLIKNTGFPELF